jgi:uncharacterized protein (TIRG00374 family)
MKSSYLKIAFGIAVLLILFYQVDIGKAATALSGTNFAVLASSLLVVPLTMALRFVRWKMIISNSGVKIPLASVSKIYLKGFFFATITPGKVGDIVKFRYLSKSHGVSAGKALSLSVLDRILDMAVIIALGVYGIYLVSGSFTGYGMVGILATCAIFFGLVVLIFSRRFFTRTVGYFLAKIGWVRTRVSARDMEKDRVIEEMYEPFKSLRKNKKIAAILLLMSLIIWLTLALNVQIIILALGTGYFDIITVLTFVCAAAIISLIPITVSGVGTREATFIFLFSFVGIGYEHALLASLIYYISNQIVPAIFGWAAFMGKEKK